MKAKTLSSGISGNLVIAGIFNDTLTLGDLQIIEMDEYHNFITKIKWTGTTGENEITMNSEEVRVFPNPAKDKIEIAIPNDIEILSFEITDKFGRRINTNRLQQHKHFTVDISDLHRGTYFIYFCTKNEKVVSKKIIVL